MLILVTFNYENVGGAVDNHEVESGEVPGRVQTISVFPSYRYLYVYGVTPCAQLVQKVALLTLVPYLTLWGVCFLMCLQVPGVTRFKLASGKVTYVRTQVAMDSPVLN